MVSFADSFMSLIDRTGEVGNNTLVFSCETRKAISGDQSEYFLVATSNGTPYDVIQWRSEYFSTAGYTPEERCREVPERFQAAFDYNQFDYLTNGTMDNQPVICTSNEDGQCSQLLVTLKPEDNAQRVVQQLENTLQGRVIGSMPMSSGSEQLVVRVNLRDAFALDQN